MEKQPILIMAALGSELGPIRSLLSPIEPISTEPPSSLILGRYKSLPIALLKGGMGQKNTLKALARIDSILHPRLIFSTGFCGGLDPLIKTGDLMISLSCQYIPDMTAKRGSPPLLLLNALTQCAITIAKELPLPYQTGKSLTVDTIVDTPRQKMELGRHFNALAVDMESAFIHEYAARQNILASTCRVVLDTAEEALPQKSGDSPAREQNLSPAELKNRAQQVLSHLTPFFKALFDSLDTNRFP